MKTRLVITILLVFLGALVLSFVTGFIPVKQKKPWPVSDADKSKVNPMKADASSIADGKALWAKHCQSCHGKTGKGDGSKAAQLKTEPGNFTVAATQSQTDGSLYYKTSVGRDDMPGFKKKIPENDDIWSIVNFVRTMKK